MAALYSIQPRLNGYWGPPRLLQQPQTNGGDIANDSVIDSQNDSNDEETDDLHILVVQSQTKEEQLMTITAAYLCEKDSLSGHTLSCWKRSGLQGMTVLQKSCTLTFSLTHFLTDTFEKSGLTVPRGRRILWRISSWPLMHLLEEIRTLFQRASRMKEKRMVLVDEDDHSIHARQQFSRFPFLAKCQVEWDNSKQQTASYSNTALMVTVRGDLNLRWLMNHQVQFSTWGVSLLRLQPLVNLVSLESFVSNRNKSDVIFLMNPLLWMKNGLFLWPLEAVDQWLRFPAIDLFSLSLVCYTHGNPFSPLSWISTNSM
uniref:Uncharacterized protein n=1 Tax=Daphnia galeata TaxID=27404 RepID=A0A8J2W065_9CRUS|nr:unnamed protein product [Daphnia galeata]